MAIPFYVTPEQLVQDKVEYCRKGIAKSKSLVAVEFSDGLLLAGENPSASLNKISEVYDRIAFAGAGKYSEFENLRKAAIRYADLKGFAYSREDVTAKSLANAFSQVIGDIFTQQLKPLEVEILIVESWRWVAKGVRAIESSTSCMTAPSPTAKTSPPLGARPRSWKATSLSTTERASAWARLSGCRAIPSPTWRSARSLTSIWRWRCSRSGLRIAPSKGCPTRR
jgi:hypothetical protein